MEVWHKLNLHTLARAPKLNAFRAGSFRKIIELMALSCEFGNPWGVVRQLDDEIRSTLHLPLDQWLRLRDLMILRGLLRQVATETGRVIYELSPDILPIQAGDGRSTMPWDDNPEMPLDSVLEVPLDAVRGRKRVWASQAEKQAYWRASRTAERARQNPPDIEAFQAAYRAQHTAALETLRNAAPPQEASSPDSVTDDTDEAVTIFNFVTPQPVTKSEAEELEDIEDIEEFRNNNRSESVTKLPHTGPNRNEKAVVIEMLSVTGIPLHHGDVVRISADVAEEVVCEIWARDRSFDRIYYEVPRHPFRAHDPTRGTRAGMFLKAIRSPRRWECPDYEVHARQQAALEEAGRQRVEQAEAQRAGREQQDRVVAIERRRLDDYVAGLTEAEIADIEEAAVASLPAYLRGSHERALSKGHRSSTAVTEAVEHARHKILVARCAERDPAK